MYTFPKAERLKSKKLIDAIFKQGNSLLEYPVKLYYTDLSNNTASPLQIAVAVSKKNIKKAVDRNLIKRRIREAYRLNKQEFYHCIKTSGKQYAIIFVYLDKEICPYKIIEEKIIKLLDRFNTINEKAN